jgi:4-hydroxy-tetrahydrodipicolinate reductase
MAIRVFLNGCNGRMGQVISGLAKESQDLEIVAGSDLNQAVTQPFPVFANAQDCDVEFDVIIDFSNPAALPNLFELIRRTHKPAVICTTGLEESQKKELDGLAQASAIFVSANMSLGVNILISLAQKAAAILYPEFDIEIIEAHHRQKVDAPSGTALMIADAINETLDNQLEYTYDRSQVRQKRGDRSWACMPSARHHRRRAYRTLCRGRRNHQHPPQRPVAQCLCPRRPGCCQIFSRQASWTVRNERPDRITRSVFFLNHTPKVKSAAFQFRLGFRHDP